MPKLVPIASASADSVSNEVLQLIAEYQRCVRASVLGLQKQTKTKDLLRAWRQGRIARSGPLGRPKGRFEFHGIGCRFQIGGRTIDFDFGPEGRFDGFDAERLARFAASAFEWQSLSRTDIEIGLKELAAQDVIVHPECEPSPSLYYWSEDVSKKASGHPFPRPHYSPKTTKPGT